MGKFNLKVKMAVSVSFLITGILLLFGMLTSVYFQDQFKKQIYQEQYNYLSTLAKEVEEKLEVSQKILQATGKKASLWLATDVDRAQEFLDNSHEALSIFDDGLFLFSPDGKLIAQTPQEPGMRGKDYSFRSYYQETVKTGKPVISDPYASTKAHRHPAVMLTVPLFDRNGDLVAILTGSLDLLKDNFLGHVSNKKFGNNGYLSIFTSTGYMLVHPDKKRILTKVNPDGNMGTRAALQGFEGSRENINSAGARGLTSYKRIGMTNWILMAHYPVEEAYRPIEGARVYFEWMVVMVVLFSVLAVWLLSRTLLGPLTTFACHLGSLPYEPEKQEKLQLSTGDEIETVSVAFNDLMDRLNDQTAELRKRRELYQIVADYSSDTAVWVDSTGNVLYISPNCTDLTGYAEEEFYGASALLNNIIHQQDAYIWQNHKNTLSDEFQSVPVEFRIVKKNGEIRWISHLCRLVHEDGVFLGVRGSFTDITERKLIENALYEEKEFSDGLIQNAVAPIFVLDRNHKIIMWNRACEELTGLSEVEMKGTAYHWKAFYDEERPTLADIILSSGDVNIEDYYRVCCKSRLIPAALEAEGWFECVGGRRRYLYFDAAPVHNSQGELVAVVETLQDMTARKHAEEESERLRDFYLTLFEDFPTLIWRATPDGKCNYFNKTWLEFTGRTLDQELGDGWAEGVHPDDLTDCLSAYARAIQDRTPYSLNYRLRRHDGAYRWVTDCGRPFNDVDGKFSGFVGTCYDITESHELELALRKVTMAIEQSPMLVMIANTEGTIEFVNPKFTEITGFASEEVIGRSAQELGLGAVGIWAAARECLKWHGEYQANRKNGESYWEEASITAIHDQQGKVTHFLKMAEDVTERKRIYDQLRKLSRAIEQSPASIVITTVEGIIEYVNPKFTELTGYFPEEVLGKTPSVVKSAFTAPETYKEMWETILSGKTWQNELVNTKKNGDFYWEAITIAPVFDRSGTITNFIAIKNDVTARKHAETALQQSQKELVDQHEQLTHLLDLVQKSKKEWEQTLDCIGDLVILADREGRIVRCNRAVAELSGQKYAELLGTKWQDVVQPDVEDVSVSTSREYFNSEKGKWFYVTFYPYRDDQDSDISGAVITLHDFTDLKNAREALQEALDDLKAAHVQMVQKEKMASIGQLAAGVAHEINNPVGFIMSNLRTLGKYVDKLTEFIQAQSCIAASLDSTGEKVAELKMLWKQLKLDYVMEDIGTLITESVDGAERVKKIVQDLKTFSRVDEADCKVADITECLESALNIVWNELKYKTTLHKDYEEIPEVLCYPQQLNQVFMNLLVNAGHAIGTQGEITVRTRHQDDCVVVSVSDTGCGIPEEIKNRIFEPFFTTKEVGKGTGLGLSISYDIVKKHGGEITVESELGKGTTFTVMLPMLSPVADTATSS